MVVASVVLDERRTNRAVYGCAVVVDPQIHHYALCSRSVREIRPGAGLNEGVPCIYVGRTPQFIHSLESLAKLKAVDFSQERADAHRLLGEGWESWTLEDVSLVPLASLTMPLEEYVTERERTIPQSEVKNAGRKSVHQRINEALRDHGAPGKVRPDTLVDGDSVAILRALQRD